MSGRKKWFISVILIILIFTFTACQSSPSEITTPPAFDPQFVEATVNAAETYAVETFIAQLTQTALSQPTVVPPATVPTAVPETPTLAIPTATFVSYVPIATETPDNGGPTEYLCEILDISPAVGTQFNPNQEFDFYVKLLNVGSKTWSPETFIYKYVRGDHLEQYVSSISMPRAINTGEVVELSIDMMTPGESGNTFTVWNVMEGDKIACSVVVDIYVK
jgi:hypothetical protein